MDDECRAVSARQEGPCHLLGVARPHLGAYTPGSVELSRNTIELTAVLTHAEEGGFIALNPETGTTSQGETLEAALANLGEATALYLEEFPMSAKGHPLVTMFTVPEHA